MILETNSEDNFENIFCMCVIVFFFFLEILETNFKDNFEKIFCMCVIFFLEILHLIVNYLVSYSVLNFDNEDLYVFSFENLEFIIFLSDNSSLKLYLK